MAHEMHAVHFRKHGQEMVTNGRNNNEVIPGNCGPAAAAAGLITCPFASFISRFTRRVVGINRVTSPMTCRICGLASIVAELVSRRSTSSPPAGVALCGGFMMLGGALSTPGLAPAADGACSAGGGMPGGKPGGRTSRGGGTPAMITWRMKLMQRIYKNANLILVCCNIDNNIIHKLPKTNVNKHIKIICYNTKTLKSDMSTGHRLLLTAFPVENTSDVSLCP